MGSPGTGGTISGAARYLKERDPDIRVVAGDPLGSIFTHHFRTGEKIEGTPYKVEGVGNDKIPSTLHFDLIDDFRPVSDREAFHMARRLTREEGIFAGGSTGLLVRVAVDVAREVDDPEACIVTFACDTGERYLSKLYNDEWMRENRMLVQRPGSAGDLLRMKASAGGLDLVAVEADEAVKAALARLEEHNVSQLPVLEGGRSVGSVTEAGLMSAVLEEPSRIDVPVRELAGEPFPEVPPGVDVASLSRELTREVPAVLVVEDGRIAGIVTRYDVLHHGLGV